MKKLIFLATVFPTVAFCQLNPSIPMMVQPINIQNPLFRHQQIQQMRADQAVADQIESQRAAEAQRQREQAAQAERQNLSDGEAAKAWVKKAKKRAHLYPDFNEVVFASDVTISDEMIRLMAMSDYAADIAYYFGTHKIESVAVANMTILDAANRIASIEQKFVGK